ncbi:unnamed protein product [Closterium sp. NIES-53]
MDYATVPTREGQTGPWAPSYFVEVPQYCTGQVWRRRDYERRGGSGRQLKLLAHGATGATGTRATGATGTLATGATGTRATRVTGSAANSERQEQRTHGRLEQRTHGRLAQRAHGRLAQRSHGRLELRASRRPPPLQPPQTIPPPFHTLPAAPLDSLTLHPRAPLHRLPHTHPPQRQLQQWEMEEEEKQGTPLTRHPPTRHPQTLKQSREIREGGERAATKTGGADVRPPTVPPPVACRGDPGGGPQGGTRARLPRAPRRPDGARAGSRGRRDELAGRARAPQDVATNGRSARGLPSASRRTGGALAGSPTGRAAG